MSSFLNRQPPAAAAAINVVLAAHRERDAMARRHHDRGRPDFDVERDHLPGLERPLRRACDKAADGLVSFLSSSRCEARSQPCATGVCGSIAPWNTTSFRSAENTRSTTKMSASLVDDETNNFSADGPVISVSAAAAPSGRSRHRPWRRSLGRLFVRRFRGEGRIVGSR